jgi:hypothetical protein
MLNTDFEAVALLERFVLGISQLRPSKEQLDAQNTTINVESESKSESKSESGIDIA